MCVEAEVYVIRLALTVTLNWVEMPAGQSRPVEGADVSWVKSFCTESNLIVFGRISVLYL